MRHDLGEELLVQRNRGLADAVVFTALIPAPCFAREVEPRSMNHTGGRGRLPVPKNIAAPKIRSKAATIRHPESRLLSNRECREEDGHETVLAEG